MARWQGREIKGGKRKGVKVEKGEGREVSRREGGRLVFKGEREGWGVGKREGGRGGERGEGHTVFPS